MASKDISENELREWLVQKIAELSEKPTADISTTAPFYSFGISSRAGVGVSGELQDRLGFNLPPTLLFDHPTIDELAKFLARAAREGGIPEEDLLE